MKRIISILVTTLLTLTASAQEKAPSIPPPEGEAFAQQYGVGDTLLIAPPTGGSWRGAPMLSWWGTPSFNWGLHQGLNMSLGASVFGSWSGSQYLGTGFSQDVSLMYAVPLSKKMSLAVGGYFSNTLFAHDSFRDAGVSAVLGYRFNEHWEAYLYGQKSLVKNPLPMPLYGMEYVGDRIGAAVRYNVNPTMSFQVNVEWMETPSHPAPFYMRRPSHMEPSTHGAPPPPAP